MANLADIDRGTKYSITGTYTDDDGDAVDISSSAIYFTVKSSQFDTDVDDSEALISKDGTITDGPSGTYAVTLTPTDTYVTPGRYFYSIKIDVADDGTDVKVLASGKVKIVGNTTNRNSAT